MRGEGPRTYRKGNLGQDGLGDAAVVKPVQRAVVHVLHAVVDSGLRQEAAIELDNVRRLALVQNVELHTDLARGHVARGQLNFLDRTRGRAGERAGKKAGRRADGGGKAGVSARQRRVGLTASVVP